MLLIYFVSTKSTKNVKFQSFARKKWQVPASKTVINAHCVY